MAARATQSIIPVSWPALKRDPNLRRGGCGCGCPGAVIEPESLLIPFVQMVVALADSVPRRALGLTQGTLPRETRRVGCRSERIRGYPSGSRPACLSLSRSRSFSSLSCPSRSGFFPLPESLVVVPELPDPFDLLQLHDSFGFLPELPDPLVLLLEGPVPLLLFKDALVPLGPGSGFEPSEKETQHGHTSEADVAVYRERRGRRECGPGSPALSQRPLRCPDNTIFLSLRGSRVPVVAERTCYRHGRFRVAGGVDRRRSGI